MPRPRTTEWVNLTDLPPETDSDELARQAAWERERPDAITAFLPIVEAYPHGVSIQRIVQDTECIERRICPDYPYSGIARFLFRYFGRDLLPRVIPELETVHARIDYTDGVATMLGATALPPFINGYSSDELIVNLARSQTIVTADRRQDSRLRRYEIADGLCALASNQAIHDLRQTMPNLEPNLDYVRIDWVASRPVDSPHPHVVSLGMGHSTLSLALQESNSGGPTDLTIDQTAAQVDPTDDYDIEFNLVPANRRDDFLRLRYGTFPDTPIHTLRATHIR